MALLIPVALVLICTAVVFAALQAGAHADLADEGRGEVAEDGRVGGSHDGEIEC